MNTTMKFFVGFALFMWAGQVLAVGLPMAKSPIKDADEFVAELKKPSGKMNAQPHEFYNAVIGAHSDLGINEFEGFLLYVGSLQKKLCPQGVKYELSELRIGAKGKRSIGWITRTFKKGEQCWYDNNVARFVGSADCGNIGREVVAVKKPKPKVVVHKVPSQYYDWVYSGKEEPGVEPINVARRGTILGYHEEIELKKTTSSHVSAGFNVGYQKIDGMKGTNVQQINKQEQSASAKANAASEATGTGSSDVTITNPQPPDTTDVTLGNDPPTTGDTSDVNLGNDSGVTLGNPNN